VAIVQRTAAGYAAKKDGKDGKRKDGR
jgi:hypothetical protein